MPSINELINSMQNSSIKYGDFLSKVDKKMKFVKTTLVARDVCEALRAALEKHSTIKIEKERFSKKSWPGFSKFLQKLGQFFVGHGFQTKRAYGRQLVREIEEIQKNMWRQDLKAFLKSKRGVPFDLIKMMEEIKKLDASTDQFKNFMDIYIKTPANPVEFKKGVHKKIQIFNGLTKEQQAVLKAWDPKAPGLSWYENNYRILKGASEQEMQEFIKVELQHFISHPEALLSIWAQHKKDPDFAKILIVSAYKKALAQDPIAALAWTKLLTKDPRYGKNIRRILDKAINANSKN